MKRQNHAFFLITLFLLLPIAAAADYSVGDTDSFWTWDLTAMPPDDVEITAECRGIGDNLYVFVEQGAWAAGDMDADDVNAFIDAFDTQTPAGSYNPDWGIYDIESEIFGEPSTNIDNNPKVYLLFYNMGCFNDTCFDGMFRDIDIVSGGFSNEKEMVHLNINDQAPSGDYMLGVLAHEFNHLIHTPMDQNEEMWFSEAMAEAAMIATGYNTDTAWLKSYMDNSDESFWGDEHSVHYGAVMVLGTFIYQELENGVADLISDPDNGLDPVVEAFKQDFGSDYDFFPMLAKAMYDDAVVDLDLSGLTPAYEVDTDPFEQVKAIEAGSIHFVWLSKFDESAQPFEFTVSGDGLEEIDLLLAADPGGKGATFSEPTLNEATCVDGTADGYSLILINPDPTADAQYTLSVAANEECAAPVDDDDDTTTDDDDDDDSSGGGGSDDDDDDDDGGCGE